MALEIYFHDDLKNGIKACVCLVVKTALASGENIEFVSGCLAMAQAQANLYGLDWRLIVADMRRQLSGDNLALLDSAKALTSA